MKEKLQLIFDMCDTEREGQVQRQKFCEFVKSLNLAAGVKIDKREQVILCGPSIVNCSNLGQCNRVNSSECGDLLGPKHAYLQGFRGDIHP